MTRAFRTRLAAFGPDTRGNVTIEAAIFMPFLLTLLFAIFSLHDAFRQKALNIKAAYTIADALSRETEAIDDGYLDGMVDLMKFLTRSNGPYSMRVTLVRYDSGDEDNNVAPFHEVAWSQTRGVFGVLDTAALAEFAGKLPTMLDNERVILVETHTEYKAPFPFAGLDDRELFQTLVFTRPRFAPQIVWANDLPVGS